MGNVGKEDSAVKVPQVSMPKGGGVLGYGETFRTNSFSGIATLDIPIYVSDARSITPKLQLRYASGSGNGIFGYGFSLRLPFIARRTDKGIPRYDGHDTFVTESGDVLVKRFDKQNGQYVPHVTSKQVNGIDYIVTAYRRRLEGEYDRIEHWADTATGETHWQIVNSDNTLTLFGSTEQARLANPENPRRVFKWCIQEQIDAHGNRVHYSYDGVSTGASVGIYPHSIRYGNYNNSDKTDDIVFNFEIQFDYSKPSASTTDQQTSAEFAPRVDPFSSFRSGFNIRTDRLCHSILMVHSFPDDLADSPSVVNVSQFEYDDSQGISLLKTVTRTGWRTEKSGNRFRKSLPPLSLDYTEWQPNLAEFQALTVDDKENIPGPLNALGYQFVDLYGDGLPGVLAASSSSLSYWRPRGEGKFQPATTVAQFPVNKPQGKTILSDISGSGNLDVLVTAPGMSGYWANNNDGTWEAFQPLPSAPLDIGASTTELIDLDGDGRADLLSSDVDSWRVSLSKGRAGFGEVIEKPAPVGTAIFETADPSVVLRFADVFGDGLQHLVRVSSGTVEVWPNLGYGDFGEPRKIPGAPLFRATVDASRVLFADTTGTGPSDLIIAYDDCVEVYRNEFGNAFQEPIRYEIPGGLDALDLLNIADALGLGTSGVVVSEVGAETNHQFLDLTCGHRPFLLSSIDNGMGARTHIEYKSSTSFYLQDRAMGIDWVSKLAMPVQVVSKVETEDTVENTRLTRVFQYRDGFFDPIERTFMGFGFVQTQDYPNFNPELWHFPGEAPQEPPDSGYVEPRLSRIWTLTGAFLKCEALRRQLDRFSYQQQSLNVPEFEMDEALAGANGETMRQAYLALASRIVREETYGVEDDGSKTEVPYSVNQNGYGVKLVQPAIDGHYAVFQTVERESVRSVLECQSDDARIEHTCNLEFDSFGQVLRTAQVNYGRKNAVLERQGQTSVILQTDGIINHVDGGYENGSGGPIPALHEKDGEDFHCVGVPFERRSYELAGFPEPTKIFGFEELKAIVTQCLADPIPFGTSFTPLVEQPRIFEWEQDYYYDQALERPRDLQKTTGLGLVHHLQHAVLPESLRASLFGEKAPPEFLTTRCGFFLQDDYWWSPGQTARYYGANQFYMMQGTVDAFDAEYRIEYDDYCFAIKSLTDPLGFVSRMQEDYQALQPSVVTDVNENSSSFLFDPLMLVSVSSIRGEFEGQPVGDDSLANYSVIEDPTCKKILADPEKYLQGASTFFFYDLESWVRDQSLPPHFVELRRKRYLNGDSDTTIVHHKGDAAGTDIGISFGYFDGMMRQLSTVELVTGDPPYSLESLAKGGPSESSGTRWLVENMTRYDDRGSPIRKYQPFFAPTPQFLSEADEPHWLYQYDALYREIGSTTPKGFLTRHSFLPWLQRRWDEDDTVLDSPFYEKYFNDPDLPPAEKQALEMAVKFENTPKTIILDPMARPIQEINELVYPSGNETKLELIDTSWHSARGDVVALADPRFYRSETPVSPAFYNFGAIHDMGGQVLALHSADAGDQPLTTPFSGVPALRLFDIYRNPVGEWDRRGYYRSIEYNLLRKPLSVRVTGVSLDQQDVERIEYGTDPSTNTVNRPVTIWDQAGVVSMPAYALGGSVRTQSRQYRKDFQSEANWNDPANVPLEDDTYTSEFHYDEQDNPITTRLPNSAVVARAYTKNDWPSKISVTPPDQSEPIDLISSIDHAPTGRAAEIEYNNGVVTRFDYDPKSYRLTHVVSLGSGGNSLLDLAYTFDPVGNVTHIENPTQPPSSAGSSVSGSGDFDYDSLYRLFSATGRHATDPPSTGPGDMEGLDTATERYEESYTYDDSGNLCEITPTTGSTWSLDLAVSSSSNHGVPKSMLEGKTPDSFFDADGLLAQLENGANLSYDQAKRMQSSEPPAGPAATTSYYQYDSQDIRARKVSPRPGTADLVHTLYLSGVIIERGNEERTTLALSFGNQLLALVDFRSDESGNAVTTTCRYQLDNRIGSVAVELDETETILTYQEYFPYGRTALMTGSEAARESKRFQFSGKELDSLTGLYYYGARYYIPSQGRWTCPDPAGTVDGPNLFAYVNGNPLTIGDPTGENGEEGPSLKTVNRVATPVQAGFEGLSTLIGPHFSGWVSPGNLKAAFRIYAHSRLTLFAQVAGLVGGATGAEYNASKNRNAPISPLPVLSTAGNVAFTVEATMGMATRFVGEAAGMRLHPTIAMTAIAADVAKAPEAFAEGQPALGAGYLVGAWANASVWLPRFRPVHPAYLFAASAALMVTQMVINSNESAGDE